LLGEDTLLSLLIQLFRGELFEPFEVGFPLGGRGEITELVFLLAYLLLLFSCGLSQRSGGSIPGGISGLGIPPDWLRVERSLAKKRKT